MGVHQIDQGGLKSSLLSPSLVIGLLITGILVCGLSFFADRTVIEWVKTHEVKTVKNIAGLLSDWGDWPELMLCGCLGLAWAWWARSRFFCKLLVCMMLSATIAGAVVDSVRAVSGRTRPNNIEAQQEWNGLWRDGELLFLRSKYQAFPSAHTGVAVAFFGVLVFARRWYGLPLLLIAGAIGWSRIYLNVHHLSDVTVGAIIGIVTAYLLWECGAAWIDRNFVIFFVSRTPRQSRIPAP